MAEAERTQPPPGKNVLPEKLRRAARSLVNWGVLLVVSAGLIAAYLIVELEALDWELGLMLAVTSVSGTMLIATGAGLRLRKTWARKWAIAACVLTALFILWQVVIAASAMFQHAEIEAAMHNALERAGAGVFSDNDMRALEEMQSRFLAGLDIVIGVICLVLTWWLVKVLLVARYLRSAEARAEEKTGEQP